MRWPATSAPLLPLAWQKGELLTVGLVIGTCTFISLFTSLQHPFSVRAITHSLVTSNAIGLTIWLVATFVRMFFRGRLPAWGIALAIPVGFFVGSWLASFTGAPDFARQLVSDPVAMKKVIVSQVILGIVVTAFFLYFSHAKGVKEALERERRRAAEALHAETLARLSLLQAQIEPHFLFNTLANIHSLIKQDPESASVVLEELNAYLRTSLRRTREPTSTVGEELQLVETLLGIAAVRLGARLDYSISVPPELRSAPLPPLLLQPLVENAVRHGIEPAVEGGSIRVEVSRKDDVLELSVHDTGVGLNVEAPKGVGLTNVRARLASLYGSDGKLEFYSNTPRGVIARLIVPLRATGAVS